ncbi:heme exporter protein CcmD [Pseudomonas massiliensis]|uniref:heme exporter protein CcmD n=1 Tax=Pseudomonas massiliensis TaxID=522492 RepID=UPI0005915587|nr:heme exporter protein CcmD [Pseudomonas massiliensis]
MSFSSLGDFLAMGRHGAYVWSAYGVCLVMLAWNLIAPWRARRRLLLDAARRARREQA